MKLYRCAASALSAAVVIAAFTVTGIGGAEAGAATSKTPIPIGFLCDCSGGDSSTGAAWAPGVQAWSQWTNAHGGIDGHPVKVYEMDTGSSTGTEITQLMELINVDHVVAIIPDGTITTAPLPADIDAAKVPVLGGDMDSTVWNTDPYIFPDGTTTDYLVDGLALAGVEQGHKNLAAVGPTGSGSVFVPLFQAAAKKVHAKYVTTLEVAIGAPNYDAQCLALKGAGVNNLALATDTGDVIRLVQDCVGQGYHPTFTVPGEIVTTTMEQSPDLNGLIFEDVDFPYFVKAPASADYDAAMKKYEKGFLSSPLYGEGTIQAWISGQMLVAALASATGPITAAKVTAGMYKLDGSTLGGLTPPLKFTKGKSKEVSCYFFGTLKNGGFSTPFGAKPICAS